MYEEMRGAGLVVITVALDRADDAREWIERAAPTHPSLIDEAHVVAGLYNMVNVPTVVWIDEEGGVARPNDVAFTTEEGGKYAAVSTEEQMGLLRRWVAGELPAKDPQFLRSRLAARRPEAELARAHFAMGHWLYSQGRAEAAARHFETAGELAPGDFTTRRGTMRHRGSDPFGPEFAAMVGEWLSAGNTYYLPLPVE